MNFTRSLSVALLLSTNFMQAGARADSPPDLPLPPCTEVDGQQEGACPSSSEFVTGEASGKVTAGGSVTITTVPTNGVCIENIGYPPYPWTPSPCYSAVASPSVAGCAVIDLTDGGTFKEMSCAQALYKNPANMPYPNFTMTGPDDNPGCGASGNFYTYVYGGPGNVPGARWSEFGPAELECKAAFNGARPDGLYGPTWVKFRVGIDQAENGDERHGYGKYAEFYVGVDGDMREELIDVDVLATSKLSGSDNLTVTYTATLTNNGTRDADDIEVVFTLPEQIAFQSVADSRCRQIGSEPFVGGGVICEGINLAGTGDAIGNDVDFIDIEARIVNVADLEDDVTIEAKVADDVNTANNKDATSSKPDLQSGTLEGTRQAMEALAPYFDYETAPELLNKQCNVYMDDIFDRMQAIKDTAPEVFANLSFGKITSGDYYWAPIENSFTRAGHVGVVVYLKGTDYHETGIVIHGTPTWSPEDRDDETQLGTMAAGEHTTFNVFREGTADHGMYYRTPVGNFPGSPTPELPLGCGYEGVYTDNQDEFEGKIPPGCAIQTQSCPFYPDAVIIRTESPVDILASNPAGQRVETQDGLIYIQELDSGIHSFRTPHEDGTFGWELVLPEDDYDIQLLGTGDGPYKLTLTTFDDNGERVDTAYEGATAPGQEDDYELEGAPPAPPSGGGGGTGSGNGGGSSSGGGGGGSFGYLGLLLMLPLLRLKKVSGLF